MTTQWQRFKDDAESALQDLGWDKNLTILNSTSNYQGPGDGYSDPGYTEDTVITGATSPPSSDPTIEVDGTETDYDMVAYIPEDTTATIRDYSETPPTRIKTDGVTYEVQGKENQFVGIIRLILTEVTD